MVNIPRATADAGAALAAHDHVDKINCRIHRIGKLIVKAAAGNLKKVSPNWVEILPSFSDADIKRQFQCERHLLQSRPVLLRRVAAREVFDQLEGVAAKRKIKVGPGLDPATNMGPLVSDEQFRQVTGYIDSGIKEGAKVVTGGRKSEATVAISSSRRSSPAPSRR